ncbi:glycoside hydrolase family 3 C-terminal domain-containing protein [Microterricola viridarii]|uniref:Exo-alpha-(1->6)-L-arabinopyranosidase n=1 Tax=Microterricola viridarii TaxID=412690 RepID=A0A1H1V4K7_9MICO|nr:glycoside hydrolase family 3 C-terminal domain-containing protein [Microterricola viridarii]SDS79316.1 beta-glucosidase [Microterricola viridarii]
MTTPHLGSAAALVSQLTLDEKLLLLSGANMWATQTVGAIPSTFLANGPNGVGKQASEADHVGGGEMLPATCFPSPSALASSWDVALVEEVGVALGRESRSKDVGVLLGPGLNIKRHPGGGRVFEYFSEDPHLSGKIAAALVRGVQSQGVGSSIKHFAGNNQETFRMRLDSIIDERTLREIYLTGFEIAVRESDPWTVMTSYNLVNGEHPGESQRLLAQILREEWGFTGLVMSDWFAVSDRPAGIRAGLDLEMPGNNGIWTGRVKKAIAEGTLTLAEVDAAATRVAELALRAAAAAAGPAVPADLDAHHALARRAAAAGTVLLRNDGILPLRAEGTIAIIGAAAETPRYQGVGSAHVNAVTVETVLDALPGRLGTSAEFTFARGYDATSGAVSAEDSAAAYAAAEAADVAVLLLAIPAGKEAEGIDRENPVFPPAMNELVRTVTAANPRTVVVLVNGAPLELPWADAPAALLEAYLGGQAAGPAIVDVLFGDAEPGGRLGESFPVAAADLPASANFPTTSPTQVQYRENIYVGYRFHDSFGIAPRFPFGHGLGYTSFEYGALEVSGEGVNLAITVPVTNTGERAGSEVVQLYVHASESAVHRPEQELKAFAKVHLEPNETRRVTLSLGHRAFAVYDVARSSWAAESGDYEIRVGSSSRDIRSSTIVLLDTGDAVTPVERPQAAVASAAEFARLLGGPVPPAAGLVPYSINSPIDDLRTTWLGRRLHGALLGVITKKLPAGGDDDTQAMITAVVGGMPLRTLVANSDGKLSLDTMERIVRVLNAASPEARHARRAATT